MAEASSLVLTVPSDVSSIIKILSKLKVRLFHDIHNYCCMNTSWHLPCVKGENYGEKIIIIIGVGTGYHTDSLGDEAFPR